MNVLITGSKGFLGKNLVYLLSNNSKVDLIMEYDRENTLEELESLCKKADAVFHLAAVLRPHSPKGYNENVNTTSILLDYLKKVGNKCPVMFASSIQAELDNPYGWTKKSEEKMIFEYGAENGVKTFVFRFPNLFGKMSRPNYSSVVATLCCETVKGLPLTIRDPSAIMKFAYVCDVLDDVVYVVLNGVSDKSNRINAVDKFFPVSLGELTYYMGVLKAGKPPAIPRSDDFFEKLSETYNWYVENIDCFKDVK